MRTLTIALLWLSAVVAAQPNAHNDAAYLQHTAAQAKLSAQDVAILIADRILSTTTYTFENTRTKETYTSVKKLPLDMDVRVACKYNNWHYTNGVTNIALMELADKLGQPRYADYVLRNMNFVFNEGNLDFFRRQYEQAKQAEG